MATFPERLASVGVGVVLLVGVGCAPARLPEAPAYVRQAAQQEQGGDFGGAVESLRIALTLDPADAVARKELPRLVRLQEDAARKHYLAGRNLKGSDAGAARREFLAALRLRENYPEVLQELRALQLTTTVGRVLRTTPDLPEVETPVAVEDELATATGLLDKGDFEAALPRLIRLREQQPESPAVRQALQRCRYRLAILSFQRREFAKSRELFLSAGKHFAESAAYLERIRGEELKAAEEHYKNGLKRYRMQQLQEAIEEWRRTLALVPEHRKAREYIEKARNLLDALKKQ